LSKPEVSEPHGADGRRDNKASFHRSLPYVTGAITAPRGERGSPRLPFHVPRKGSLVWQPGNSRVGAEWTGFPGLASEAIKEKAPVVRRALASA
jgi:hypothetical protein